MSRMLHELQRWQRPLRSTAAPDRWSNWAQALSARHGRIVAGRRVGLTLAQPGRVLRRAQHWHTSVWQCSPQFRLAITPLLRAIAPPAATIQHHYIALRSGASAPVDRIVAGGQRTIGDRRSAMDDRRPTDRGIGAGITIARVERAGLATTRSEPAPLQRLITRLVRAEVDHAIQPTRLIEHSAQIVQRVVVERQRIEGRVADRRETVVRQSRSDEPNRNGPVDRDGWETIDGRGHRSGTPLPAPPPAINIEQVADQVLRQLDRRISAHQERMGRRW
jgi:hypothetical protein